MMLGGTPFFQNNNPRGFEMYEGVENSTLSSSACPTSGVGIHSQTLWYNLSLLREKVHQVQTLVSLVFSPDPIRHESIASASSGAAAIIQEIIVAASSMMYALQQAAVGDISNPHDTKASYEGSAQPKGPDHVLNDSEGGRMSIFGAATHYNAYSVTPIASAEVDNGHSNKDDSKKPGFPSSNVIELDAADLLAKYSHYCQVCGKGFKRDANLRMHMRAHGDEYKTNAALCNPMKGSHGSTMGQKDDPPSGLPRKYYSCMPSGRVSMEQEPRQVPASQVGDMCQEPLQEEPLPEDVCVQAVQPEEILSAVGFEDAREALRGSQVDVFMRDNILQEG